MTTTISPGSCPYCGSYWHSGMCPRIKAIEYHPNGQIKSIELRDPTPPFQQVVVPSVTIEPGEITNDSTSPKSLAVASPLAAQAPTAEAQQ